MSASASASWMRQLGSSVRSVKFLLCPTSASSRPALEFFTTSYNVVKHLNPTLPFSLRGAPGKPPSVVVEFDFGQKAHIDLDGLDIAGVERKMVQAVETGFEMPRSEAQSGPKAVAGRILPSVVE